MLDHAAESCQALSEIAEHRAALNRVHREGRAPVGVVAGLNDQIRDASTRAKLHAELAQVQALREVAAAIREVGHAPIGVTL